MRKYILLFVSVLSFCAGYAQSKKLDTKEFYLQQSKSARSTGYVILGTGLALIGTAAAIDNRSPGLSTATASIGLISSIGSIPFFIKAGKLKQKATLPIKKIAIPESVGQICHRKFSAFSLSIYL